MTDQLKTHSLDAAIDALQAGHVIAYPTESVYGLGCDPYHEHACQTLCDLKARHDGSGWICVIGDLEPLQSLVAPLSESMLKKLHETWPGPTTWVLPAAPNLPPWLMGPNQTIAVRYSAHPVVQALCKLFKSPLISTSANLKSQPPARDLNTLRTYFDAQTLPVVLEGDLGGAHQPCRMLSASGNIIRH